MSQLIIDKHVLRTDYLITREELSSSGEATAKTTNELKNDCRHMIVMNNPDPWDICLKWVLTRN